MFAQVFAAAVTAFDGPAESISDGWLAVGGIMYPAAAAAAAAAVPVPVQFEPAPQLITVCFCPVVGRSSADHSVGTTIRRVASAARTAVTRCLAQSTDSPSVMKTSSISTFDIP